MYMGLSTSTVTTSIEAYVTIQGGKQRVEIKGRERDIVRKKVTVMLTLHSNIVLA
jgi:hypothetical protein